MRRSPKPVTLLVGAESIAVGFVLLVLFADKFLGLGPDGTLTAVLLLSAFVLGVALLAGLPPLVWLSTRSLLVAADARTTLSVGSVTVGVCMWLLVASWLAFVFLVNVK